MDKWDYVRMISRKSDKYGDLLIELMERSNKDNLSDITELEAKEFYEELQGRNLRKQRFLGIQRWL